MSIVNLPFHADCKMLIVGPSPQSTQKLLSHFDHAFATLNSSVVSSLPSTNVMNSQIAKAYFFHMELHFYQGHQGQDHVWVKAVLGHTWL